MTLEESFIVYNNLESPFLIKEKLLNWFMKYLYISTTKGNELRTGNKHNINKIRKTRIKYKQINKKINPDRHLPP
jgi:hypothetical protein